MTTLVLGGTGMLGTALRDRLEAVYVGSEQANLLKGDETYRLFEEVQPDCVIHCAARVGGIKDNSENQYRYFTENARINLNVISNCVLFKVPKVIAVSSTCVYPANPPSFPITEDMLHAGPPEKTNYGYAFAKRMMQVQIDAAREQFGFKWSVIYPSNLYGPHDTFDLQRSHVVPALMLKMHNAKVRGDESVTLMGTGKALRQFTFVADLAHQIVNLLAFTEDIDFNYAPSASHSIEYLSEIVAGVVGFEGDVLFDGAMDGVMRKDVRGWMVHPHTMTPLHYGLSETYRWFLANKPEGAL